jgi:hypothetical protein
VEAGFSSNELITTAEAFTTQSSDFKLSTEDSYNHKGEYLKPPNQLVYASSASHVDSIFYQKYRNFSKRMILGDRDYFCADIPCLVPISPMVDGVPAPPLLTQSKVDAAMSADRIRAEREYYNKFLSDSSYGQIVKWAQIRRNETFDLPEFYNDGKSKYAIAFDAARAGDNSIVSVMKISHSEDIGYYGEIVNCTNLIDIGNKRQYNMTTPEQVKFIKQTILDYNGNAPDYQNIGAFLMDSGAGGGAFAHADYLLEDWNDKQGRKHKGFLDATYDVYEGYEKKYPNASNILRLISPKKYRTQMVDEFVELMGLDLIKFSREYNGTGYLNITEENGQITKKPLSMEEEIALTNIDIMKTEITSIVKYQNPEGTNKKYALSKERESTMHDDRFYTIILLAHYLFELRRSDIANKTIAESGYDFVFS